ncbi:MAG: dATP/dGTP diphosphohydrolase domain-containing protein [Solirubrobacteraceae bacterium]
MSPLRANAAVNPKDQAAEAEERCPLDLLEPAADEAIARALANGRDKYRLRNFTDPNNRISYRVYLAAMRRHINALLRDEDLAPDSGLHHLAHVGANVHVLMAAMEAGTLVDDRNPHRADVTVAEMEEAAQPGLPDPSTDPLLRPFPVTTEWADRVFGA